MINKTEKKGEKKHIAAPKACFLFDLNFTSQSLQEKKKKSKKGKSLSGATGCSS